MPAGAPSPVSSWQDKYQRLVTNGAFLFAFGLWVAGMSVDTITAAVFFIIAAVFAVAGLWVSRNLQRSYQTGLTALVLVIFSLSWSFVYWRSLPAIDNRPSNAAAEAQVAELHQLQNFLNAGIEHRLRTLFDFDGNLRINIRAQAARIKWIEQGNTGNFPYPQPAILHVTKENLPDANGPIYPGRIMGPNGVNIVEGPRDVYIQPITIRYQAARDRLELFIGSPLVPENIKLSLAELKKALDSNNGVIYSVVRDKKKLDDRYFTKAEDQSSKFGFAIWNEVFSKSYPLAPSANDALKKIQSYLKTG